MAKTIKTTVSIGDFVHFNYKDDATGLLNGKRGVVVKAGFNKRTGLEFMTVKRPNAGVATYSLPKACNLVKF